MPALESGPRPPSLDPPKLRQQQLTRAAGRQHANRQALAVDDMIPDTRAYLSADRCGPDARRPRQTPSFDLCSHHGASRRRSNVAVQPRPMMRGRVLTVLGLGPPRVGAPCPLLSFPGYILFQRVISIRLRWIGAPPSIAIAAGRCGRAALYVATSCCPLLCDRLSRGVHATGRLCILLTPPGRSRGCTICPGTLWYHPHQHGNGQAAREAKGVIVHVEPCVRVLFLNFVFRIIGAACREPLVWMGE